MSNKTKQVSYCLCKFELWLLVHYHEWHVQNISRSHPSYDETIDLFTSDWMLDCMLPDLPPKTTSTSLWNWTTPARNRVEKWEKIARRDIHHRRHLVTEHPRGSVHLPPRTEATIMRPCHHRRKARIYLMVEVQRLILQQRRQRDSGVDLNNLVVGAIPGAGVRASDSRLFVFITDVPSAANNGTNNRE